MVIIRRFKVLVRIQIIWLLDKKSEQSYKDTNKGEKRRVTFL